MQHLQMARAAGAAPRLLPPAPVATHAQDGQRQRSQVPRTAGCEQTPLSDRLDICGKLPARATDSVRLQKDARLREPLDPDPTQGWKYIIARLRAAAITAEADSSLRRPKHILRALPNLDAPRYCCGGRWQASPGHRTDKRGVSCSCTGR